MSPNKIGDQTTKLWRFVTIGRALVLAFKENAHLTPILKRLKNVT